MNPRQHQTYCTPQASTLTCITFIIIAMTSSTLYINTGNSTVCSAEVYAYELDASSQHVDSYKRFLPIHQTDSIFTDQVLRYQQVDTFDTSRHRHLSLVTESPMDDKARKIHDKPGNRLRFRDGRCHGNCSCSTVSITRQRSTD